MPTDILLLTRGRQWPSDDPLLAMLDIKLRYFYDMPSQYFGDIDQLLSVETTGFSSDRLESIH